MDSPAQPIGQPQARFRRLLTFGDVLDESMLLFRRHWVTFAVVSAVSLLPPGLILVWLSGAGLMSQTISLADLQSGRLSESAAFTGQMTQIVVAVAYTVVYSLFGILWSAAVVVTTDSYLRGEQPTVKGVYSRALPRYGVLLLSSLVYGLGFIALTLLASVPLLLIALSVLPGLVGVLLELAAIVICVLGLVVWWLRPSARTTWFKWLIILTAPYGLPTYFGIKWAMYIAAVVLENNRPVAALKRSAQLTDQKWFRVAAILVVATLIVAVMLSVLSSFVTIPFTVAALFRGQFGLTPSETAITNAVSFVVRILLASVGSIVYTVVFVDLRNRREGTDILERVSQLEASVLAVNG